MSNSTVNPLAHNSHSQGDLWVKVTIPFYLFTAFVAAVRIWWRRKMAGSFAATDIFLMISLLCVFIQEILGCIAIIKWGLGHHAAYIGRYKTSKALMYFYIYQIFYKILVSTTKMSFVFLYLDLFPTNSFKIICWITQASIVAAMVAFVSGTIFQCTPIPYFWNRTIKGGHCIDPAAFWYGHAAWNTACDVLVLLLPIPVIRSLKMGRNQKVAVFGVFSLGAFVIIASVMRMIALNPASKVTQADMTYLISTSNAFLWTQLESCVAVICVCLPTLKGLVSRFLPSLFSTTRGRSSQLYDLEEIGRDKNSWRDGQRSDRQRSDGRVRSMVKGGDGDGSDTGSMERIIGIKRTVDVRVTEGEHGRSTAEEEMFRAGSRK